MAGPILKPQERRSNRSLGPDGDASTSSAGKSSASIGRKPEPSIPETPEDETTEVVQPPGRLSVPPPVSVLSPSGVVSNSPQPISTLTTPAQTKSADANLDYLNVKSSQHYTAPSPSICEKTSLDARKAGSLDPSVLANLAKMEIKERANELENKGISPNGAAVASKALNDQMMAGASSRPGLNDVDGVFRRDTMLSPSERNARLELLESEAADGHARSGSSGDKSLKDAMEQGISKPFKIEWIRV